MSAPLQGWVQSIVDQLVQHRICAVVLLEWFVPGGKGLVPVVRHGSPVIARISLSPEGIAKGNSAKHFHHKLWSMENRFDKRTISDHPATVRISLDYLLFQKTQTRVDVKSPGRMFSPARLAAMDPQETAEVSVFIVSCLVKALGGPEIDAQGYMRFMNALNSRLWSESYRPVTDWTARYSGEQSLWLSMVFDSLFSGVRMNSGTESVWEKLLSVLNRLYSMLDNLTLKGRKIRHALRPMVIDGPNARLKPLRRLHSINKPIEDVLFLWTTETLHHQVQGYATLAPQTRFVWCTRGYVVLLDVRVARDDWHSRSLLPDLYMLAIDTSRELGYLLYLNQHVPGVSVTARYALLEVLTERVDQLLLALSLSNVRFSLPHAMDIEKLDDVELEPVELGLPKWMRWDPTITLQVRRISDVQRTSLDFSILPRRFERYIQQVIDAFMMRAYKGVRLRVNYDVNKHYLLETNSPQLLGFVSGINRVNGEWSFFPMKVYHNWMDDAFRSFPVKPWHVLAWRFFDIAVTAGLTCRFARYLWMLDRGSMESMFGWRTVAADAGLIPIVGDPMALKGNQDGLELWGVTSNIPTRHYGRVLDITPERFEEQVIGFDLQRFLISWPAMKSMLDLLMEDD